MSAKTVELILIRNAFYARSYRQIKRLLTVLLIITIILVGFIIWQANSSEFTPKYFPTTPDGKLIISPPVSENHLALSKINVSATGVIYGMPPPTKSYYELQQYGEDALILYWTELALLYMFDYDYVHYRTVIENARKFFTPKGHENFIQALIDSRNLETVRARSAVVIPELTGPVKLIGTKMVQNHYTWDLEAPLKLTYESVQNPEPIVQNLKGKISVARVSTLLSPFYGLSIYRLNFEQVFEQREVPAT
jgi:intracellular multiplication protein IcmL